MGIVSEGNVHDALAYLAEDPHPLAKANFELTKATNAEKETWAKIYGDQQGSIKDKEAATDCDARVIAARAHTGHCEYEVERHRSRARAAGMIIEVWRTENANARAAERIR